MDLLNDADSERFKKLVASSVKQMQLQRSGDTHQSLNGEVVDRWVCFFLRRKDEHIPNKNRECTIWDDSNKLAFAIHKPFAPGFLMTSISMSRMSF